MRIPDRPISRRSALLAGAALVGGLGLGGVAHAATQRALSSLSLRAYGADPLDSAIKVFVGLGTQRNLAAFWWRVVGRPEAVQ